MFKGGDGDLPNALDELLRLGARLCLLDLHVLGCTLRLREDDEGG